MATISWINGSGNWSTAADWSTGALPGLADGAVISAPGAYTVSITSSISVGSIAIDDNAAVLAISGSGVSVSVGETITNAGQLSLQSYRLQPYRQHHIARSIHGGRLPHRQ